MWQRFTQSARESILGAQILAGQSKSANVGPVHLFLAVLQSVEPDSNLAALLLRASLSLEEAKLYAHSALEPDADFKPHDEPRLNRGAKRVIELSADEARRAGDSYIGTEHLLLACLRPQRDETLLRAIAPLGWDLHALRAYRRELKAGAAPRPTGHPLQMLTGDAQKAVDAAYSSMRATFCGRISSTHLLLGLLSNNNRAVELLGEIGVSSDELKSQTRASLRSDGVLATPDKRFDKSAKRAFDRAKLEAQSRGYRFIGADHILLGLLPRRATVRERLTWGNDVQDDVARVLASVDEAKLRAVMDSVDFRHDENQSLSPLLLFIIFISQMLSTCLTFFMARLTNSEVWLPLIFVNVLAVNKLVIKHMNPNQIEKSLYTIVAGFTIGIIISSFF